MLLRNLIITQVVMAVGLGAIYLLPKTFGIRESAIIMALPSYLSGWSGKHSEPSQKVLESLAEDTDYEQAEYYRWTPGRYNKRDRISTFIVLSGDDMNNSIHRPERCLDAQGFDILESSVVELDVGRKTKMPARRLLCRHREGGFSRISYYWFTGAAIITPGHYKRTLTDMWDRLVTGTNQRWAYVTISAELFEESTEHPFAKHSPEATDAMISEVHRRRVRRHPPHGPAGRGLVALELASGAQRTRWVCFSPSSTAGPSCSSIPCGRPGASPGASADRPHLSGSRCPGGSPSPCIRKIRSGARF